MVIVDTSVWLDVLRGAGARERLERELAGAEPCLTRFTQMELLVGVSRAEQWQRLERYLDRQRYAEADHATWRHAARTFVDLRRTGTTVRSPIDCCIAEIAIAHDAVLLHRDRDFTAIAAARPLRQRRVEW